MLVLIYIAKIEHIMTVTPDKQKLFLDYCSEVESICRPLFDYLPITFFRYVISFKDNTKIVLSSDYQWLQAYFDQAFYKDELANFVKHPDGSKGISVHSSLCGSDHVICNFWEKFSSTLNYDEVLAWYSKYANFLEFYNFGFSKNNHHGSNIFLNNPNLMKNFMIYFKDKGQDLINEALANRFTQPPLPQSDFRDNWLLGLKPENTDAFLQTIKPERIFLDGESQDIFLTPIESQCLKLILEGNKYKAISDIMARSPRTIESYAAKIKEKFGVRTKTDLLLFCSRNHILDKLENL